MADVKSKNLYELLGNTSDQDSDREPDPPTKAIDKPAGRSGKRDAPKEAPAAPAANNARGGRTGRGDRTGGFNANETAFRDRMTGRDRNRQQDVGDDAGEKRRDRGRGQRGGPRRGGDRHSRTAVGDHQKQVGHGWGEQTGDGEWADERAGEKIATEERKEAAAEGGDANQAVGEKGQPATIPEGGQAIEEAEPEPEDNSKSYAEYLTEKAAQKLEGLGLKEARAPNEGAKDNKKWKSAKELTKEEDADYFKGEEKAGRQRDRSHKAKEFLDIDYTFKEQSRGSDRGGRGGRGRGRGDRGDRSERGDRGGFRGDRGGDRGERGEFRGGRGRGPRGDRGDFRGGERRGGGGGDRGGRGAPLAVDDQSAFPSLGGK